MDGGRRRLLALLGVWLTGFALTAGLHVLRGAFDSGFGAGDDEAAHVVSSVMIHDYLRDPSPANPIEFAKDYYTHYPKVAIGQWPPAYHVSQAFWTLLFGVSRESIVLFGAALAALAATILFGLIRRLRGPVTATSGALLFLALPLVQRFSSMPGTEVLLALLALAAVVSFGRFLDSEGWRPALAFSVFSALAILTKGNGLGLALMPPIAIVLRRQWSVLRSPALWSSAGLVAVIAGPWTLWFLGVNQSTWGGGLSPSADYSGRAALSYAGWLTSAAGPLVLGLAAWGTWQRCRARDAPGVWSAALAWCVAVLAFHVIVPSSIEARHLVLLLPCLCLFAAEGARDLASRTPRLSTSRQPAAAALALLACFAGLSWSFPRKDIHGFDEAVAFIKARHEYDGLSVLVDSGPMGEGLAVTEFMLVDERPGRHVVRATKFLSHSSWTGQDYVEHYPDPEALAAALREAPIGLILFDGSLPAGGHCMAHRETLRETLRGPGWRHVASFDVVSGEVRHEQALELWEELDFDRSQPFRLEFAELVGRDLPGVE